MRPTRGFDPISRPVGGDKLQGGLFNLHRGVSSRRRRLGAIHDGNDGNDIHDCAQKNSFSLCRHRGLMPAAAGVCVSLIGAGLVWYYSCNSCQFWQAVPWVFVILRLFFHTLL